VLAPEYASRCYRARVQVQSVMSTRACGHHRGILVSTVRRRRRQRTSRRPSPWANPSTTSIVRALHGRGKGAANLRAGVRKHLSTSRDIVTRPRDREHGGGQSGTTLQAFGVPGSMRDSERQTQNTRSGERASKTSSARDVGNPFRIPKRARRTFYVYRKHQQAIRDFSRGHDGLRALLEPDRSHRHGDEKLPVEERTTAVVTITTAAMDIIAMALSCGKVHAAPCRSHRNDQPQYTIKAPMYERFHLHISHATRPVKAGPPHRDRPCEL